MTRSTIRGTGGRADPAARPERDDAYLWRATPSARRGAPKAPLVHLPGIGPQATGRTRAQRLLQRLEVLGLARTFEVWLVARRSPVRAGTTIADLAAQDARAIRARFDGPVDVVGESTGGSVALQLALDHPDVVRRLVLVSAASRLPRRGRDAQGEVARSVRAGRARRAAGSLLAATTDRPLRNRLLRGAGYLLGRLAIGRADRDLVHTIEAEDGFDVDADLSGLAAPTLVIGGGRDGYYPVDLFRRTAARIPNATYVEYARKGHLTAALDGSVRRAIRAHLQAAAPGSPQGTPEGRERDA